MDKIEKLKYELTDINDGLLIKLRYGSDINDEIIKQFGSIKSIIKNISVIWRREKYLPKELCGIFADFFPAIESCLPGYDRETADRLLGYADEIMELIRSCCVLTDQFPGKC